MSGSEKRRPDVSRAFIEANEADAIIRPARPWPKKRPPPLSVRVSEEERQRLKRDAEGESVNGYIRRKLFGAAAASRKAKRQPHADHKALAQILGTLGQSRLASNLNQIAKAANMGALPVNSDLVKELHEACADIRAMRRDLLKALGLKAE